MATKKKTPKNKRPSGGSSPNRSHRAPRSAPPPLPPQKSGDPFVSRLEHVVRIMERSSLQALAYEDADIKVELTRGGAASSGIAVSAAAAPLASPAPPPTSEPPSAPEFASTPVPAPKSDPNVVIVRSPIVGTFYQAPSPGAPLFTGVGQTVKPGQTLCIIEAMKLMNEIECEVSGTVVEVLVENAQPVQYDDALFRIAVRS